MTESDEPPSRRIHFVFLVATLLLLPSAFGTTLGVNYYHESMMSDTWKVPYYPRTQAEVGQDLDHISHVSTHVKLYMNPFVAGNRQRVEMILGEANQRGFHTVVVMNTEDRTLGDWNWGQYRSNVLAACNILEGKTDAIAVGNEITLHSGWSDPEIRNRVVALINDCSRVFSGEVLYEAFWYTKDAWKGYTGKLQFNMYENINSFTTNVQEKDQLFGTNADIGEFGDDLSDEGRPTDVHWQGDQIRQRWNVIAQSQTPVAYVFTYREPSYSGFGLINDDGSERPGWQFLKTLGGGSPVAPAPQPVPQPTPVPPPTPTPQPTPPPTPGTPPISQLAYSCIIDNNACQVQTDQTSGTCRTIKFSAPAGIVTVVACDKNDGNVETYRIAAPSQTDFTVCVAAACVKDENGFGRAPMSSTPPGLTPTQPAPSKPAPKPPVVPSPAPLPSGSSLDALQVSCTHNGVSCSKQSDVFAGACRTTVFGTSSGSLKLFSCDKNDGHAEVYVQQKPSGAFSACVGPGCVTQNNGFARFALSASSPAPSTPAPQPPSTSDPLMDIEITTKPAGSVTLDQKEPTGCRRIAFETSSGNIDTRICPKNGYFEFHRLSPLRDVQACVGSACIGSNSGYAEFS